MKEYACVNSMIVAKEDASLPINDLAILRGYGVFDFFLVYDGIPLFFEDHWQRLNRSADALHLPLPFSREELIDILNHLYKHMPYPYAGARITLTGGNSPDGYAMGNAPNSLVTLQPLQPLPSTLPQKGIGLMTHEYVRPLPGVKSIDYMVGLMLFPVAKQKGFDELLYIKDGMVSECPRSNVFAVTEYGVLITPSANVLHGITRSRIIGHARKEMKVEERPVSLQELKAAKEVFISSTTKGIWAVGNIDGQVIGNGGAGKLAGKLYQMLLDELPEP